MKPSTTVPLLLLLSIHLALADEDTGWNQDNKFFKPASAHEGPVAAFLRLSIFESQQLDDRERFPNVVVAMDGTVIAAWNGVRVRRSSDGGATWGASIPIAKGFMGGGFTVDEISAARSSRETSPTPPSTSAARAPRRKAGSFCYMRAVHEAGTDPPGGPARERRMDGE